MDIMKTEECDQLNYFLLPLSSACDLTRAVWNMRWVTQQSNANGFDKATVNDDGSIVLNNCDDFLISSTDPNNPTGL